MRQAETLVNRAIWCAVVPLVMGILLCAGWWRFRALWMAAAGLIDLVAGVIAFAFGIASLRKAGATARAAELPPGEAFGTKRTVALFVLFGNFPAALVCIFFAIVSTGPLLFIHNASGKALNDAEIVDDYYGTPKIPLGNLQPGEMRRLNYPYTSHDTGPFFRAVFDGRAIEKHLTAIQIGDSIDLTIYPNGTIQENP